MSSDNSFLGKFFDKWKNDKESDVTVKCFFCKINAKKSEMSTLAVTTADGVIEKQMCPVCSGYFDDMIDKRADK